MPRMIFANLPKETTRLVKRKGKNVSTENRFLRVQYVYVGRQNDTRTFYVRRKFVLFSNLEVTYDNMISFLQGQCDNDQTLSLHYFVGDQYIQVQTTGQLSTFFTHVYNDPAVILYVENSDYIWNVNGKTCKKGPNSSEDGADGCNCEECATDEEGQDDEDEEEDDRNTETDEDEIEDATNRQEELKELLKGSQKMLESGEYVEAARKERERLNSDGRTPRVTSKKDSLPCTPTKKSDPKPTPQIDAKDKLKTENSKDCSDYETDDSKNSSSTRTVTPPKFGDPEYAKKFLAMEYKEWTRLGIATELDEAFERLLKKIPKEDKQSPNANQEEVQRKAMCNLWAMRNLLRRKVHYFEAASVKAAAKHVTYFWYKIAQNVQHYKNHRAPFQEKVGHVSRTIVRDMFINYCSTGELFSKFFRELKHLDHCLYNFLTLFAKLEKQKLRGERRNTEMQEIDDVCAAATNSAMRATKLSEDTYPVCDLCCKQSEFVKSLKMVPYYITQALGGTISNQELQRKIIHVMMNFRSSFCDYHNLVELAHKTIDDTDSMSTIFLSDNFSLNELNKKIRTPTDFQQIVYKSDANRFSIIAKSIDYSVDSMFPPSWIYDPKHDGDELSESDDLFNEESELDKETIVNQIEKMKLQEKLNDLSKEVEKKAKIALEMAERVKTLQKHAKCSRNCNDPETYDPTIIDPSSSEQARKDLKKIDAFMNNMASNGHKLVYPPLPKPGVIMVPTGGFAKCCCKKGCTVEILEPGYTYMERLNEPRQAVWEKTKQKRVKKN